MSRNALGWTVRQISRNKSRPRLASSLYRDYFTPVGTRLKYVTHRHAQNCDGHWCVILAMVNSKSAIANFLVDCLLAHPGSIGTRPLDDPGSHLSSLSQHMDSDLSHSDQTPIYNSVRYSFLDNLCFIVVTTHVGSADIS